MISFTIGMRVPLLRSITLCSTAIRFSHVIQKVPRVMP
jgi:hypothetical protein